MPGLSASQEIHLEYMTWQLPDSLPVVIRRRAMEGIHREVSEAFAAAPHRCAETGGILLGRREEDRIIVEDFEPVPSEHQFGPSYRLSDTDLALLQETLDWFRSGAQPGLAILGFYRSHTLPNFDPCAEDPDLMQSHFAAAEDLLLLVKPGLMGSSDADFFISHCGHAPPPAAPHPPPLLSWPAPRPRYSADPEPVPRESTGQRWLWYAAAALVGLVGGALGYLWWHPDAGLPAPTKRIVATAPRATPPIIQGTPAPPQPDTSAIHDLLDHWAGALKRADFEAAAQFYTPVVVTYFDRHDVTRENVRQAIRQARARSGRLDLYRISGLAITPVSDDRAVATFRKHWQAAGRAKSTGEQEERMTLVRTRGVWQISSEQAESDLSRLP